MRSAVFQAFAAFVLAPYRREVAIAAATVK
jgi:hypothetical protein